MSATASSKTEVVGVTHDQAHHLWGTRLGTTAWGNSSERPTLNADAVRIAYEAWDRLVGARHAINAVKDKSNEHESQRIDVLLRP
jgi:hypothetical protein